MLNESTEKKARNDAIGWSYELNVALQGGGERALALSESRGGQAFFGLNPSGDPVLSRLQGDLKLLFRLQESSQGVTLMPAGLHVKIRCNGRDINLPVSLAASNDIEVNGLKMELRPTGHVLDSLEPPILRKEPIPAPSKGIPVLWSLVPALLVLIVAAGLFYKATATASSKPAPAVAGAAVVPVAAVKKEAAPDHHVLIRVTPVRLKTASHSNPPPHNRPRPMAIAKPKREAPQHTPENPVHKPTKPAPPKIVARVTPKPTPTPAPHETKAAKLDDGG